MHKSNMAATGKKKKSYLTHCCHSILVIISLYLEGEESISEVIFLISKSFSGSFFLQRNNHNSEKEDVGL